MNRRFLLVLLAGVVVFTTNAAVNGQAPKTNFSVTLGDKVVLLPAPEAYEEATTQFEVVKNRFTATVPPDGDLLAGYLPAKECELLRKGQPSYYPSWVIVSVYRPAREHVFSREEFGRVTGYADQEGGKLLIPDLSNIQAGLAQMDKALSKEYSKDVKLDLSQPKLLGVFDRRPNVHSNLMMLNIKVRADEKEVTTPVLASLTMLFVKQRVIGIYAYQKYHSEADGEALMQFTTKWINEILAAN